MQTLLLNVQTWDLSVDTSGNIALASNPYSMSQDVASAIKTFRGEAYYDTTLGVPYWQGIIGHLPPISLIKSKLVAAALTVPGVTAAVAYISSIVDRDVRGQVQCTASGSSIPPVAV